MSTFPSSIISFTTHVDGQVIEASDINTPNTEIVALETKVGVDNSSVVTSLDYIAKNAASNGGGHVQTANTGGTGQTMYNKGDLLIGQSSSVLAKQSAGPNGYAVIYDSTQANGLSSGAVLTAPAMQQQTYTYGVASYIGLSSVQSVSQYSVAISPIPSVLTDGMSFDVKWGSNNPTSVVSLIFSPSVVGSVISASVVNPDGSNIVPNAIRSSVIGTLKFSSSSSVFQYATTPDLENVVGSVIAGVSTLKVMTGILNVSSVIGHGFKSMPKLLKTNYALKDTTGVGTLISNGNYDGTTMNYAGQSTGGAVHGTGNIVNLSYASGDTDSATVSWTASVLTFTCLKSSGGSVLGNYFTYELYG